MALDDLDFSVSEDWEQFAKENPSHLFIPEFAKDETGNEFLRGRGFPNIYRVIDDDKLIYECIQCNGKIRISVIIHPKFEDSKINYYEEHIPFCPNCEDLPKPQGDATCSIPGGSYDPSLVR
jgi:hypothetical protein